MGYSLSWLAFRGRTAEAVWAELRLRATGEHGVGRSPFLGTTLPDGWSLVLNDPGDRFVDEDLLSRLSRGCEAVACFLEEHVMFSQASGWRDGRQLWLVKHDCERGPMHLDVTGEPPALFGPIREAHEDRQRAADEDVDHIFDVPIELAKALVGFRHDELTQELDAFEVLVELPPEATRKGLWNRLLGR